MRSGSSAFHPDAKDMLASSLAREILAASSERAKLSAELGRLLQDDKTYRCLLTILGIGPKSASALATSLFLRDSKLAAYCGLTPADHDSGSSIRSQRDAHKGNKALKILLIFSCNSLVGTKKRFGRYYDACISRGMRHNKALKAVARKRLRVIYAVMRDGVPYVEPPADDAEKSPAMA